MVFVCFVTQGVEQDAKKTALKYIISSGSYGFFKSGSQYNYYTQGVARLKKFITSARNNIFKCVFASCSTP